MKPSNCTVDWLSGIRSKLRISLFSLAKTLFKSTDVHVSLGAHFWMPTTKGTLDGLQFLNLTNKVRGSCSILETAVNFQAVAERVRLTNTSLPRPKNIRRE